MSQDQSNYQTEIPVPIAQIPNACPSLVWQAGTGVIALSVIIGITVLIRSLTDLVKAKS